jgi:branched-chain amino acid transport system substrate-binding protein
MIFVKWPKLWEEPFTVQNKLRLSLSILYATLLALILPVSESDPEPKQKIPVTIGFLVPDSSNTGVIGAAERAIQIANEAGGYNGIPFKLVVRTTEGPWGAGSKESVGLVYEDEVRAIVGSLDGRNAHLAEQVVAKSHLVYLETKATDPTLSQAYVPWFLRNVPNDNQQAKAILELIGKKGAGKTAFLVSEDYDARYAVKSLTEQSARKYGVSPLIISVNPVETAIDSVLEQLTEAATNHLVVPFFSETTLKILSGLKELRPDLPIYGTLKFSMSLDSQDIDLKSLDGMILVHSYAGPREKSGQKPMGLDAAYAYDGINLILEAILEVGLERESIRDYILNQDRPKGLTGPIKFDELGNRSGRIQFAEIRNGVPVPIN